MRDKKAAKALARKSGKTGADSLRYDDLDKHTKEEIKRGLLEEQGYICCYCMRRIELGSKSKGNEMRIEHWHSQSRYEFEQLNYKNLLASCNGETEKGLCHCDRKKANVDITYNPAESDIESKLSYLRDGTIHSSDLALRGDIDIVLNLNLPRFKMYRKAVARAVENELDKKPGERSRSEIEAMLSLWLNRNTEGKLQPYSGVALFLIRKRLKRA